MAYLLVICFYILEYSSAIERQRLFIVTSDALYINDVFIYYNTKEYIFQLFRSIIDYKYIKQLIIIPLLQKQSF